MNLFAKQASTYLPTHITTRGCDRWGAARYGAVLAVEYVHATQSSYHIDNTVLPTTQLAAATLTSDPLTLKLVHGVLVSQEPFLPSLVFVGLFVFPLGGGTSQTDRQTDGQDQHMIGPPSRKDGRIIKCSPCCWSLLGLGLAHADDDEYSWGSPPHKESSSTALTGLTDDWDCWE